VRRFGPIELVLLEKFESNILFLLGQTALDPSFLEFYTFGYWHGTAETYLRRLLPSHSLLFIFIVYILYYLCCLKFIKIAVKWLLWWIKAKNILLGFVQWSGEHFVLWGRRLLFLFWSLAPLKKLFPEKLLPADERFGSWKCESFQKS